VCSRHSRFAHSKRARSSGLDYFSRRPARRLGRHRDGSFPAGYAIWLGRRKDLMVETRWRALVRRPARTRSRTQGAPCSLIVAPARSPSERPGSAPGCLSSCVRGNPVARTSLPAWRGRWHLTGTRAGEEVLAKQLELLSLRFRKQADRWLMNSTNPANDSSSMQWRAPQDSWLAS